MIADLKPYPAMKDSGIEWLGEVPEHWEVRRTKTVLRERSVKGFPNEPLLAATQTKGVVRKDQYENRTVLALKDLHLLKLVRVGDFVISLRSFQGGIEFAREQGIISPAYTVLYADDPEDHGYLGHLFKSKPYIENLGLYVTGIRQGQNIDYEKLSRSGLPLPSAPEQAAIVRFLDHADRRIRRYIRAKQKLIKLLEEQKQAIIHQAVTGQIDVRTGKPYPTYKPSGVEWLGDVPEHWVRTRIKNLADGSANSFVDGDWIETPFITNSGVRLIQCGNVGTGRFKEQGFRYISEETFQQLNCTEVSPGDILICRLRSSPRILAGRACIAPDLNCRMITSVDNCIIKTASAVDSRYVVFLLSTQAYLQYVRTIARGGTRDRISRSILGGISLALPLLTEQTVIVEHLLKATASISSALDHARSEITLLHEYRTHLIADVVTGKLDVREAAANLPDESDETEQLDEADDIMDDGESTSDDLDEVPEEVEA